FASFGGCLAKSMFFAIVYEVDKKKKIHFITKWRMTPTNCSAAWINPNWSLTSPSPHPTKPCIRQTST
ncbi:MAG: hypothetical protein ABSF34_16160, partial [Verrucomicrobiota bacterium]